MREDLLFQNEKVLNGSFILAKHHFLHAPLSGPVEPEIIIGPGPEQCSI